MSENKIVIGDEAVEAAARSAYEARPMKRALDGSRISWDGLNAVSAGRQFKEGALAKARAALEAAAPHMLAEAWDEGCAEGFARGDDPQRLEGHQPNPHRSQA